MNEEIRKAARENGVFLYQIADELKIYDANFSRLLRRELPSDKKKQILAIIQKIADQQEK